MKTEPPIKSPVIEKLESAITKLDSRPDLSDTDAVRAARIAYEDAIAIVRQHESSAPGDAYTRKDDGPASLEVATPPANTSEYSQGIDALKRRLADATPQEGRFYRVTIDVLRDGNELFMANELLEDDLLANREKSSEIPVLEGVWACACCMNVERREREVRCWKCGVGEMIYRPFTDDPLSGVPEPVSVSLKKCVEAVILNKRGGMPGQFDPNWYPSNFEYGNIEAEVQTVLSTAGVDYAE